MRHAPPFRLELRRDFFWTFACAALGALSAAAGLLAVHQHWPLPAPAWVLVPALSACSWWGAAPALKRLHWDTQCWQVLRRGADDEVPVHLRPVIDLQCWLLLRAQGAGWRQAISPHFLALSRRHHPAEWTLLRATLYSQRVAPAEARSDKEPP